ncbi:hypothetical protein Tco_1124466 [Tanacetum coccineum]|uniref:Uncharacterized protein n=1 Tax=Tanacetum coccineum TaxID=301880 RepID=A0ABQ5J673_9ASTR
MMTYLKHVGNFKHSELKSKKFEDIQAMYEKIKRSDEDFIAIGSVEDDRLITKMNKKDSSKEEEIKQESKEVVKEEDKGKEFKKRKPFDESKRSEEINMNVRNKKVLSVFDREDLDAIYKLVMDIYQDKIPEGVHTLMTDEGLVIHMLIEKKYPLKKEIVVQMLKLKLESEEKYYVLGIDHDLFQEDERCYLSKSKRLLVKEHPNPLNGWVPAKEGCKDPFSLSGPSSKISFHMILESLCKDEKGIKNDIEPITPTMTVNRLVLKWEEKIKLHQEKEIEFDRWRNTNLKNERSAPVKIKDGVDDEGEVTLYLTRRSLEVLRKFHWMILGGRFN